MFLIILQNQSNFFPFALIVPFYFFQNPLPFIFFSFMDNQKIFKSMDKSFSGGVGTYSVTHSGSTDDLLTQISKKLPGNYEVTGEDAGKIDLKVK